MSLNYKNIAVRTLQDFLTENPTMTLGEVFYSIFREGNIETDTKGIKNMSDEDIYSAIEKAKQFEKE